MYILEEVFRKKKRFPKQVFFVLLFLPLAVLSLFFFFCNDNGTTAVTVVGCSERKADREQFGHFIQVWGAGSKSLFMRCNFCYCLTFTGPFDGPTEHGPAHSNSGNRPDNFLNVLCLACVFCARRVWVSIQKEHRIRFAIPSFPV